MNVNQVNEKPNHYTMDNEAVLVIGALLGLSMFMFVVFFVWKFVKTNQRKRAQLEALTPSAQKCYSGIMATQAIQFVVPTITLKNEVCLNSATEESDSDCLVGYHSDRDRRNSMLSTLSGRRRSSMYDISADEISKGLYDDFVKLHRSVDAEISFVLHYSYLRQQLLVTILSARNLPKKKQNMNSLVKVCLLPEKTPKFVSKVQKHTNNPAFNELFIFNAIKDSLDGRALCISVYNCDSFSRKSLIGRCLYQLSEAGISSGVDADVITEDINCMLLNTRPSGELLVSLTYKPESSTLTLSILKAKNITMKEINTIYVKVRLFMKNKRIRSRKSSVRRIQDQIEFNDTFHVSVASDALNDIAIGISVYGKSSSLVKHLIGKLHLGENSPSEESRHHWSDMINNYNSSVNQWYIFS